MGIVSSSMLAGLGRGISDVGNMRAKEEADRKELAAKLAAEKAKAEAKRGEAEITAKGKIAEAGIQAGRYSVEEGSVGEEAAAAELGMSIPEFRAFRKAQQTGDYSAYETEEVTEEGMGTSKSLPSGFKDWLKRKQREYGLVLRGSAAGKATKEIEEAATQGAKTDIVRGMISGEMSKAEGAETMAASEGKGAYEGTSETTRNVFTGKAETTPYGKEKAAAETTKAKAEAGLKGEQAKSEGSRRREADAKAEKALAEANQIKVEGGNQLARQTTVTALRAILADDDASDALKERARKRIAELAMPEVKSDKPKSKVTVTPGKPHPFDKYVK